MARKRAKKQTLPEFKAWLEGMEEIQPEDWAPSATQWQTIREKINNVIESKPAVDAAMMKKLLEGINTNPSRTNPIPQPQPGNPYPLQAAHIPPPPQASGGVPAGPMTAPTPEASAVMPPQQAVDVVSAAKPNLDTSDGNYDSSFS